MAKTDAIISELRQETHGTLKNEQQCNPEKIPRTNFFRTTNLNSKD